MGWDKNQETDEQKVSRINSAGLINSTLEKLWLDCYSVMARGDYLLCNTKLDSIWAILGGDEDEGGDKDTEMNEINLKIYENGSLKAKMGQGFNKKSNPNNAIQYQWLMKKSLFLRRLQNSQGKGTAYASDDDDDID